MEIDQKPDQQSEYLHLGHKLERHVSYVKSGDRLNGVRDLECLDHDIICCRCGWEIGKHYEKT